MKAHELAAITRKAIEKRNNDRPAILLNEIIKKMKSQAEACQDHIDFMFTFVPGELEINLEVLRMLKAMGYESDSLNGGVTRISWAKAVNPICRFDIAWQGSCKKEADETGFCSVHKEQKCCMCGKKATRECDATFQFVCGSLLCDSCKHHP
jgi:hypothetical protein